MKKKAVTGHCCQNVFVTQIPSIEAVLHFIVCQNTIELKEREREDEV